MTARDWLKENGYPDVAAVIDEVLEEWLAAGKKTRRNWWGILAGGVDGRPLTAGGRVFPVLAAAQEREGKPVTSNALRRGGASERAPARVVTGRWIRVGEGA